MRNLALLLAIFIYSHNLFSQKTERYSGDYYNGTNIKGESNYAFYQEKNKKIKHGPFRYSARAKGEDWRYSHSISGEFSKGFKNGNWTYNLNSKSHEKDKLGFYYNITVDLTANYKNGLPDGEWMYTCYVNKYKKVLKGGRMRKAESKDTKDIKIIANWKNGKLIDSLIINDKLGKTIHISMNNFGVLINHKTIKGENTTYEMQYLKGIESSKLINGNMVNNSEYFAFSNLGTTDNPAKKIKHSLFDNQKCIIAKYIDDNLFNNDYFLYKYIEGDKLLHTKLEYGDYTVNHKGLYYYTLEPIISSEESEIIKKINIAEEKTKESLWYYNKEIKKNPKDKKLKSDRQRVRNTLLVYKDLQCNIKAYKKHLSLINLLENNSCNKIHFDKTPRKRQEFLQGIKRESDKQFKLLSTYNQYH